MSSPGGDLPDWQTLVKLHADQSLGQFTLTSGQITGFIDVSQYLSVVVSDQNSASHVTFVSVLVHHYDVNQLEIAQDFVSPVGPGGLAAFGSFTVPVRGVYMRIETRGASDTYTFVAYGSGRTVSGLLSAGYSDLISFDLASAAYVVGQIANLGIVSTQGMCQVEFTCDGGTLAGDLDMQYIDRTGTSQDMRLVNAAQQVTDGSFKVFTGQVIFPAGAGFLKFICRAAGTGAVHLKSVPLGH